MSRSSNVRRNVLVDRIAARYIGNIRNYEYRKGASSDGKYPRRVYMGLKSALGSSNG